MCCAVLCCVHRMQALPPAVCKLTSLEYLSVNTCMHVTQLPDCLTQMSSLTELALHNGEVGVDRQTPCCAGKCSDSLLAIDYAQGTVQQGNSLRASAAGCSEVHQAVQHASDMCVHFRSSASPSRRGHCMVTAACSAALCPLKQQLLTHCVVARVQAWPVQLPALPSGIGHLPSLRKIRMTSSHPPDDDTLPVLPSTLAMCTSLQEVQWGNLRLQRV